MRYILLTGILMLCLLKEASAQIARADFDFNGCYGTEGARLDSLGPNFFKVHLGHAPNQPGWPNKLNFQVHHHAKGQILKLAVAFDGGKEYPFNEYFQSYNQDSCKFCSPPKNPYSIHNHKWVPVQWKLGHKKSPNLDTLVLGPFQADCVYVGTQVPFTWQDMEAYLDRWPRLSKDFQKITIGKSRFGRPLLRVRITSEKYKYQSLPHIYIAAQHPGEHNAQWRICNMIDWLLSDEGADLRRRAVFEFVPVMSPDALGRGWYRTDGEGHDMNRTWLATGPDSSKQGREAALFEADLLEIHKKHPITAVWSIHTWPGKVDVSCVRESEMEVARFGSMEKLKAWVASYNIPDVIKPLYRDTLPGPNDNKTWAVGPAATLGCSGYLCEGGGALYDRAYSFSSGVILMQALSAYYTKPKNALPKPKAP